MKKLLGLLLCLLLSSPLFAKTPYYVFLPNLVTQYLESVDANSVISAKQKIIELVKNTLQLNENSQYSTVRIRLIYNEQNSLKYLVVYLLSSVNKSVELVRINVTSDLNVTQVIRDYELQTTDLSQSPNYAVPLIAKCPDTNVEFVIGNNFKGDSSVEKEVQKTFQLAKEKGYHPVLLNMNNSHGPQPTVQAYLNWMSCPQLKGFYNESHGWTKGIVLSDDDFTYDLIKKNLPQKLATDIVLFDSCQTFHNPLLEAVTNQNYANAKQYVAGFISLPFGASERTATCFWRAAFNSADLHTKMLQNCARDNGLQVDGYKITGNGDNHLEKPAR